VAQLIEEAQNVRIEHPVHALPLNAHRQRVQVGNPVEGERDSGLKANIIPL
jgi:hypothetical protein